MPIKKLSDFDQISVKILAAADKTVEQSAQVGRNAAVKKAPVDEGILRGSITAERVGFMWFRLFTNIEYAIYQEFGTAFFRGNFFMKAGYDAFVADFFSRMKKKISKILVSNIS